MKNNITELVFILDRSGSMSGLENDTVGGFNSMIEKQKVIGGECFVTTILFDNTSKILHDRVALNRIPKMTDKDYTVGGSTALLDAIGGAICHISDIHKYARPEDVPERTMFIITTDGEENSSREYTADRVKEMIKLQKEEHGWEFIFMAANIDAVGTAANIGIDKDMAVNYHSDSKGTQLNYAVLSEAVSSFRQSRPLTADWKKSIDDDFKNRKK